MGVNFPFGTANAFQFEPTGISTIFTGSYNPNSAATFNNGAVLATPNYFGTTDTDGTESTHTVRFGQPTNYQGVPGKHFVIGNQSTWDAIAGGANGTNNAGVIIGFNIDNWKTTQDSYSNVIIGEDCAGAEASSPHYQSYNVTIGYKAASRMQGSTSSVCIGYQAGRGTNFSSGGYYGTIYEPLAANYNVFIGRDAGFAICQGDNNIAIGWMSGTTSSPSGSLNNNSNIVVLGNDSINNFYCADTSISSSDVRDKTDIEDFTAGLSFIESLRPVTYRWDKRSWYMPKGDDVDPDLSVLDMIPDGTHKREKLHVGFIAQEMEAVEQAHGYANSKDDQLIVNLNEDDTAYGVKYERLVPILVNAIKELKAEINELRSQIN